MICSFIRLRLDVNSLKKVSGKFHPLALPEIAILKEIRMFQNVLAFFSSV